MRYFLLLLSLGTLITAEHIQYAIRRGEIPMRGVNLGGWLVAEHWMTYESVIWEGVPNDITNYGEYKTMQFLGHDVGDKRFEQHRATFIQESDIAEIAAAGLNAVRVPVGYWIVGFDNQDPSQRKDWQVLAPGALKYLDLLIKQWAKTYNLAVLISIHAAKGSQNGNDHSSPSDPGKTYWGSYSENVKNTIDVADFLAARYEKDPAFLGIGLLNEPAGTTQIDVLKQYYYDGYFSVRKNGSDIMLTHAPLLWEQDHTHWADFTPPPTFQNFIHEWHKYLVWGFEDWSVDRLISEGVPGIKNDIAAWTGNWLFIGEWSVASNKHIDDEDKFKQYVKAYFESLKGAHAGWTFWTWKVAGDTEGRKEWSFRNLLRSGYIEKSYYDI